MFDYYNNLDGKPLVQAIEKHREFYLTLGFDMHKDAISLSGLAEKIMFKISSENQTDNTFHIEKVLYKSNNPEESDFTVDTLVFDNKETYILITKNVSIYSKYWTSINCFS